MKLFKKSLAIILLIVMTVAAIPVQALDEGNIREFSGGFGTEASPYLISSPSDLENVASYPSSHFKQTGNVYFDDSEFESGGYRYNNGNQFRTLGAFSGVFDGNGYIIDNIHMTNIFRSEGGYFGLFTSNSGTIKNLRLTDFTVHSLNAMVFFTCDDCYVGIIAGKNTGSITNCYATGALTSQNYGNTYTGGLVGINSGKIENSYNNYNVTSIANKKITVAGGIAGINEGTINSCYNLGTITATKRDTATQAFAGGIAGKSSSTIQNCYNAGAVIADFAGGIAGETTSSTITYCYNVGTPTTGGIIGLSNSANLNYCYYLYGVPAVGSGSITGSASVKTADEMRLRSTYAGFNFNTIWTMDGINTYLYPELIFSQSLYDLTSITVLSLKTVYAKGSEFDNTSISVLGRYSNGYTKALTDYKVSGFNSKTLGTQTITVTHGRRTATYDIEIVDYLLGDINNSGTVDLGDVVTLAQYVAGWDVSHNANALNTNGVGNVDLNDVVHLAQYVAGWDGIILH